jgi:hypothetical protein
MSNTNRKLNINRRKRRSNTVISNTRRKSLKRIFLNFIKFTKIVSKEYIDRLLSDQTNRISNCGKLELYCFEEQCQRYQILNDRIGQAIHKACSESGCNYVAKLGYSLDILNEWMLQHDASLYNIAPKVRQILLCQTNDTGTIIMDAMSQTLEEALLGLNAQQLNEINNQYIPQLEAILNSHGLTFGETYQLLMIRRNFSVFLIESKCA